jgi:hypothetical protein
MRRIITIVALAATLLAAGEPAFAQTPNIQLQVQPKLRIQPKVFKAPTIRPPLVPPSLVIRNIKAVMPSAKVLKLVTLPTGDFVATIRIENQVRKIGVDGETGAVQN